MILEILLYAIGFAIGSLTIYLKNKKTIKRTTPLNEGDLRIAAKNYAEALEKVNPATEAYDFEGAFIAGAKWAKLSMFPAF